MDPHTPESAEVNKKHLNKLAKQLLETNFDDLPQRKKKILEYIAEGESIARNPNRVYSAQLTFGDRVADFVAQIGGSWPFIFVSIICLGAWMLINSPKYGNVTFDPFPYIFLNLMLSMLAAFQAPVIMMSQNRQSDKDRIDANTHYEVSLKMELEIKQLLNRIDELEEKIDSELIEKFSMRNEDSLK